MNGTFIEVKKWGDFSDKYTYMIMYSSEKFNVKNLVKEFCSIYGLESDEGLPFNMLDDTTDEFIKFLKKFGFVSIKTYEVIFSD